MNISANGIMMGSTVPGSLSSAWLCTGDGEWEARGEEELIFFNRCIVKNRHLVVAP